MRTTQALPALLDDRMNKDLATERSGQRSRPPRSRRPRPRHGPRLRPRRSIPACRRSPSAPSARPTSSSRTARARTSASPALLEHRVEHRHQRLHERLGADRHSGRRHRRQQARHPGLRLVADDAGRPRARRETCQFNDLALVRIEPRGRAERQPLRARLRRSHPGRLGWRPGLDGLLLRQTRSCAAASRSRARSGGPSSRTPAAAAATGPTP